MSKKQRALLEAEVQKLLKEQRAEFSRNLQTPDSQAEQPSTTTPELPHPVQPSAWMGHAIWDSCSARSCALPRMQLQRKPLVLHTPEKVQTEATIRKSHPRDQQLHWENVGSNGFHSLEPYCSLNVSTCLPLDSMISATELGESGQCNAKRQNIPSAAAAFQYLPSSLEDSFFSYGILYLQNY